MAAIDEEKMLRSVQMQALSMLVAYLLEHHFIATGRPDEASRETLDHFERLAAEMSFDDVHPAQSDLAAQELRDSLIRVILRARSLATGEPFDPKSFHKDWRKDQA
jgi:hypothetical protein